MWNGGGVEPLADVRVDFLLDVGPDGVADHALFFVDQRIKIENVVGIDGCWEYRVVLTHLWVSLWARPHSLELRTRCNRVEPGAARTAWFEVLATTKAVVHWRSSNYERSAKIPLAIAGLITLQLLLLMMNFDFINNVSDLVNGWSSTDVP